MSADLYCEYMGGNEAGQAQTSAKPIPVTSGHAPFRSMVRVGGELKPVLPGACFSLERNRGSFSFGGTQEFRSILHQFSSKRT